MIRLSMAFMVASIRDVIRSVVWVSSALVTKVVVVEMLVAVSCVVAIDVGNGEKLNPEAEVDAAAEPT